MRILILSWRDIKHPYGGGAELLSHEMAKRWVEQGDEVIHFSAMFPGGTTSEVIDGVLYLREGQWTNVHIIAMFKILFRQLPKVDVIVDEVHGIPFFAPLYTRIPVVCLVCEVAREIWDQMYPFPLNFIGKILEKVYLMMYKNMQFLTISESTKTDLVDSGIKEKNITIVPMGFTYSLPNKLPAKESTPTLIFLGRLAKSKGIPDAIQALSIVRKSLPKAKLWVIGKGVPEYEAELRKLVKSLKLESAVIFKGFVDIEEKFRLLSAANLILVPSVREGWGLIVPEANVVGTPAIVYNVPGLRDVTKNGRNGVVVAHNTPEALASAAVELLENLTKYKVLSKTSLKYAKSLNWDDTAKVARDVLKKVSR